MIAAPSTCRAHAHRFVTRDVDVLIEPDLASFGMLQFQAIDALIERGYAAGVDALKAWREARNGTPR